MKKVIVKLYLMFAFVIMVNQLFAQDMKQQMRIATNVDSMLREYERYATFTENQKTVSQKYMTRFKDLFKDKGFMYNDLVKDNPKPHEGIYPEIYANNVKDNYPEGLSVTITVTKKGTPVLKGKVYEMEVEAEKRIVGFPKDENQEVLEETYPIKFYLQFSDDLSGFKFITVEHSTKNKDVRLKTPAPVIVATTLTVMCKTEKIAEATITIDGETYTTGADGTCKVEGLKDNSKITVSADNYNSVTILYNKVTNNKLELTKTEIAQDNTTPEDKRNVTSGTFSITCTVYDDKINQTPSAGANVTITINGKPMPTKPTDKTGKVSFDKIPAKAIISVSVEKTDFRETVNNMSGNIEDLLSDRAKCVIYLEKAPILTRDFTVTVVDDNGSPVSGAKVTINKVNKPTSQKGEALFSNIPEKGKITIDVEKDDYVPIVKSEIVLSKDKNTIRLTINLKVKHVNYSAYLNFGSSMMTADGVYNGGELKSGLNYGLGFGVDYAWKRMDIGTTKYKLSSGARIGYSAISNNVSLGSYNDSTTEVDLETDTYIKRLTGSGLSEDIKIAYLDIPISLLKIVPDEDKMGFYVNLGMNISMAISQKSSSSGTYSYRDYYEEYHVELFAIPEFGLYDDKPLSISDQKLDLKGLNMSAVIAAGISIPLSQNKLNIGLFYQKGFSNLANQTTAYFPSTDFDKYQSLLSSSSKVSTAVAGIKIEFDFGSK